MSGARDDGPLDCIVIGGDLPREFLGTEGRERMRLQVEGTPASLNFLARYFASGRDAEAARAALAGSRRSFVGLNAPYICQFLRGRRIRADWIALFSAQTDDLAAMLARGARVVVISTTFLPLAEHIDAMAAAIKQLAPQVTVLAGGSQVWKSYQHRLLLDRGDITPDIASAVAAHNYLMDAKRPSPLDGLIVARRGEETLAAVVQRIRAGRPWNDLPNVAVRADGRWRLGQLREGPYRPVVVDWRQERLPPVPLYLPVQAGQGCGHRCSFCDFCGLFPRVRVRPPAEILNEIRTMPEVGGLRRIYFTDDNLLTGRRRARELCRALIDSGMRLRWRGMFRVNVVDTEIAELLARSGCVEVMLGIESGDPDVLANMNKRITPERILAAAHALDAAGISTKSFYLVGFPGETPATVDNTVALINAWPTAGPAVHRYMIFTFAPLPLAAVASPAARSRWGLEGYGFRWRHATMDWEQAEAQLPRMFAAIKPELSPSYSLEVPEVPGLDIAAIKRIYRLRNDLAVLPDADPGALALWDELDALFAPADSEGLVAAS